MNRFDYKDFRENPEKYKLYTQATLTSSVFTENGYKDLKEGTVLEIQYLYDQAHPLYWRTEPMYLAFVNGEEWGPIYASNLKDFK